MFEQTWFPFVFLFVALILVVLIRHIVPKIIKHNFKQDEMSQLEEENLIFQKNIVNVETLNLEPIQKTIDAIDEVLNVHENHLYKSDEYALLAARVQLMSMQKAGFK